MKNFLTFVTLVSLFFLVVLLIAGCGVTEVSDIPTLLTTPYSQIDISPEPGIQPPTTSTGTPIGDVISGGGRVITNPVDPVGWGELLYGIGAGALVLTGVWGANKAKKAKAAKAESTDG